MIFKIFGLFIFLTVFGVMAIAGEPVVPDLFLHYTDFSYVSSIALGFKYVYFGTGGGVIRYEMDNNRWADPLNGHIGDPKSAVHDIAVSFDDDYVWVTTDNGIHKYSRLMKEWQREISIPNETGQGKHLLTDNNFYAPWGYSYLQGGALTDTPGRIFQFTDILQDDWGNLWIGIWGLGVGRSDVTDRRINLLNFGLLQPEVNLIFSDSEFIWLTGPPEYAIRPGITAFDPENNEFFYAEMPGSLINTAPAINDILIYNDTLYAATENGILLIDRDEFETIDHIGRDEWLSGNHITCLEVIDDIFYAGSPKGLHIINLYPDTAEIQNWSILNDRIITCLTNVDGTLWIGTDHGAYRYKFETKKLEILSASEIGTNAYFYDIVISNNKMWLLSDLELYSIDLNTATIEVFPEINSFGGAIAIAVNDTLVAAATAQGLLMVYDGIEKRHTLFSENDGLWSNTINDLAFRGEYLWIGSPLGLTRFWYKNPALY
jgi:ligand-binding sensor domain-containing protein